MRIHITEYYLMRFRYSILGEQLKLFSSMYQRSLLLSKNINFGFAVKTQGFVSIFKPSNNMASQVQLIRRFNSEHQELNVPSKKKSRSQRLREPDHYQILNQNITNSHLNEPYHQKSNLYLDSSCQRRPFRHHG